MEKTENQLKFVSNFKAFIDSIEINEKFDIFVEKFKNHKYFEYCAQTVEKLENDFNYGKQGVKLFIFCSFTRDRETCATIVQLLEESYLKEQAKLLREYNTSSGPMEMIYDVELEVITRPSPFKLLSNAVTLSQKPRGKCIIINNVEEPQMPPYNDHGQVFTPIGLKRETERFKHVFSQLHFEVKVLTKLNAKQIKEQLTEISKDESLKKDQAFVLIVLSHGENETVLGYDACQALKRINFEEIPKNDVKANKVIEEDRVHYKDLVDIFSAKRENDYLNCKPKLHFFICCRVKSEDKTGENKPMVVINVEEPKPKEYVDTFISFACAEGYESFYDDFYGLSNFGQALTHCIAQYACDYPLGVIMTRTSERLQWMYSEWDRRPRAKGCYAIQVNTYSMSFQLFFNPGHYEEVEK